MCNSKGVRLATQCVCMCSSASVCGGVRALDKSCKYVCVSVCVHARAAVAANDSACVCVLVYV